MGDLVFVACWHEAGQISMLNSGGSLLIGSGDKKKFYTAAATAAELAGDC